MSNHRALLEQFAGTLSAKATEDRSRTIGAYVVTAINHYDRSRNLSIHWKVDGRRIAFKRLLLLMKNEDGDASKQAPAEASETESKPNGRRPPIEVINSVRLGNAIPMVGRPPVAVAIELRDALLVALRAGDLAAAELGPAFPSKPTAGSPAAWLNYALATIARDERNGDANAVHLRCISDEELAADRAAFSPTDRAALDALPAGDETGDPVPATAQRALLKQWFPWIGTDDEVNGCDVIETIGEWFESVEESSTT